jgi:hypothetical protein
MNSVQLGEAHFRLGRFYVNFIKGTGFTTVAFNWLPPTLAFSELKHTTTAPPRSETRSISQEMLNPQDLLGS